MRKTKRLLKSIPNYYWFILIGFLIVKKSLGNMWKGAFSNTNQDHDKDVINSLQFDYTVGFPQQKAELYASSLLDAFNYNAGGLILGGTDTETIDSLFSDMSHPKDYAKVYKAFGKQKYNGQGSATDGNILHDEFDLTSWLKQELDIFDFSLKKKVKNIILKSGLPF